MDEELSLGCNDGLSDGTGEGVSDGAVGGVSLGIVEGVSDGRTFMCAVHVQGVWRVWLTAERINREGNLL